MSDNEEKVAGHLPATVVAEMRVSGSKTQQEIKPIDDANVMTKEEEKNEKKRKLVEKKLKGSLIDGVFMRIEETNPPQAIKSFHEKPSPKHSSNDSHPPQIHIFQPPRCTDLPPKTYIFQPGK